MNITKIRALTYDANKKRLEQVYSKIEEAARKGKTSIKIDNMFYDSYYVEKMLKEEGFEIVRGSFFSFIIWE